MKIVRFFLAGEDDNGIDGFVPLWIPKSANFDAGTGFGLLHDMLEHGLSDKGTVEDEAVAFGRIIALRVIPWVQTGVRPLDPASLGSEIGEIWGKKHADDTSYSFRAPPQTEPITGDSGQAERLIREMGRNMEKGFLSETGYAWYEDGSKPPETMPQHLHDWLIDYLRLGYRDALRRYGSQDHGCYEVGHGANREMRNGLSKLLDSEYGEAKEIYGNEDCGVLRLCYDTQAHSLTRRWFHASDQYGRYAYPWLRQMLWTWERS